MRLDLASALQGLPASVGRNFLVQRFGGLPRLEEEAWARKSILAMHLILRQSHVPGCQNCHSGARRGAGLSKAGKCVGLVHTAR